MNKCECTQPGFCQRYNRVMNAREHQYCQGTSGLPKEIEQSYLNKLLNFGIAVAKHIITGGKTTSNDERARRLAICALCEKNINQTCIACGCPIEKKVIWESESCPLNKWANTNWSKPGGCGCHQK